MLPSITVVVVSVTQGSGLVSEQSIHTIIIADIRTHLHGVC